MTKDKTTSFVAYASNAQWIKGLRTYFTYRDLGANKATQGKILAQVIRAEKSCDGPMGYHSHVLDFQMVYLLKGWAKIYLEDLGEIRVEAGDAWYQAPGVRHEVLEYSEDWEVIEITMPADFVTKNETR